MPQRGLWLALGVALVVRAGVLAAALWADISTLNEDPDAYVQIGRHVNLLGLYGIEDPRRTWMGILLAGRPDVLPEVTANDLPPPQPTAIRTPLYPLVMAGCVALAKSAPWGERRTLAWLIAGLHLACGLATVWLTWTLAGQWGVKSQLGAALLVACDPLLVNQSRLVMTESVATLLAVVWLAAMTRLDLAVGEKSIRTLVAAGVLTSLAALCRPTFLPLAGVVTAVLISWAFTRRTSWRSVLVYLLAAGATLAPWVARNQWQFGKPIVATTHGGYTLLLGNNPRYYRHVRDTPHAAFDGEAVSVEYAHRKMELAVDRAEFQLPTPVEVAADREANDQAWHNIQADPQGFLLATVVRWQSLWRLVPLETEPDPPQVLDATRAFRHAVRRVLRYATGVWYGLEFALAALGLFAVGTGCWKGSWRWGLLLILVFAAVHSLYWTDMRMRAPLMPVIALAAAAGWDRLLLALIRPAAGQKRPAPPSA